MTAKLESISDWFEYIGWHIDLGYNRDSARRMRLEQESENSGLLYGNADRGRVERLRITFLELMRRM